MDNTAVLDAVVDAARSITGVNKMSILGHKGLRGSSMARKICAYVAHRHFGVEQPKIDNYFLHSSLRFKAALIEIDSLVATDANTRATIASVQRETARLLEARRKIVESQPQEVVPPASAKVPVDEAKKLRAKGFSIGGLARRYGVTPEVIAPLIGERWGLEA